MAVVGSHMRVERYRLASLTGEEPLAAILEAQAEGAKQHSPQEQAAPAAEIAPPPPPPPTFSEQEMALAKQLAFQEGLLAGKKEAEAARDKEAEEQAATLQSLLGLVANRVTIASETHLQLVKLQQEILIRITLAIARKVAGDALRREPYASVEALIKECIGLVSGKERLLVAVTPQKYEGLRQSVDSIRKQIPEFAGEIAVEADATLADDDCRVEWNNGQAARSVEALWADVESLVRNTLLTQ